MAEGSSSHDVPMNDHAVLRTLDDLAGYLRASIEAPESPEPEEADTAATDEEVLQ